MKDDPEAREVRAVGRARVAGIGQPDQSDQTDSADQARAAAYAFWLRHRDPAVVANAIICLIHQANYLLDQQIGGLERGFIREGGYSERLAAARIAERQHQRPGPAPGSSAPVCPLCDRMMALRTARHGANAGSQFWGCTGYPECRGTRKV